MVHGENGIEMPVHGGIEESVCGEGAVTGKAGICQRLDGRHNHLFLFMAYHAAVAGMGVECQNGNAGRRDVEVAAQRLVEHPRLLHDTILSDGKGHFRNGQMGCHQSHPHQGVAQYHQRFAAVTAEAVLKVFGVAGETEVGTLDAGFLDGSCHQHVNKAGLEVLHGLFQCHESGMAGLGTLRPELHLDLCVGAVDEVELAGGGIFRRNYLPDVGIEPQGLAMVGKHLGVAIDYRRAEFQHQGIGKGFQYDLRPHSVGVALGDAHTHRRTARLGIGGVIYCRMIGWHNKGISLNRRSPRLLFSCTEQAASCKNILSPRSPQGGE